MSFSVYCNNKGCGKTQIPLLDTDTNEVICSECNKSINSITSFAKAQMKAMGLVKKASATRQAFAVGCKACKKSATPVVKDNVLTCCSCNAPLTDINKPYETAIRQYLKSFKG